MHPPAYETIEQALTFEREELSVRTKTFTVINASSAIFVGIFWFAGYSPWRTAVLSAGLGLALLAHLAVVAFRRQLRDDPTHPLHVVVDVAWNASLIVQVCVTGGIRSPIFPRLAVNIGVSIALFGITTRRPLVRSIVLFLVIVLLPFAPESWSGPQLPGHYYWIVLYLVGAVGIATAMLELSAARRVAEVSFVAATTAREEVVERAMRRTRDLERLTGRIAHELKNPLSAIKTLAQASFRTATDAETRMHLEVIEREAKRMQDALEGHLSFSRPNEGCVPSPASLGLLADETIGLLRGRALNANVRMRRKGDATADVDALRVRDALLNLLVNALEASSPGGEIVVEISSTAEQVTAKVCDTGRGMSVDVLSRLGTPYFTTRNSGNGLGVALARAAFEQHGGSLAFESVPGVGTTAIARIPVRGRESA